MDIVLVNPHYGGNAGRVLRLCKNFNIVNKLVLVNPLFDLNDLDFIKGCASAKKYINDLIRIENDLSFLKDYSLIIGTSCKYKEKYYSKANIDLESFVKKFSNKGFPKKTSILFGREPSGLTREELKLCDMILYIPTSTEYPSLNLSMAVGIVLYRLFVSTKWRREKNISKEKIKYLKELVYPIIEEKFHNDVVVKRRFDRILMSGIKDDVDLNILISLFQSVIK